MNFEDLLGTLLSPSCEGEQIRFALASLASSISFRCDSFWPTQSLTGSDAFLATLSLPATQVAGRWELPSPMAPRFGEFSLYRSSNIFADALSSTGDIQITFLPRQAAEAVVLESLLEGGGGGLDLSSAHVEVTGLEGEVVIFRPATWRLILAARFEAQLRVELLLRGCVNPQVPGSIYWTLRSFAQPRPVGPLVTAAQAAAGPSVARAAAGQVDNSSVSLPLPTSFQEIVQWLDWAAHGRDEISDLDATPVRGLLVLSNHFLESSFLDSTNAEVSFELTLHPGQAEAGQRFLIFSPRSWALLAGSFQGLEFPAVEELGLFRCLQRQPSAGRPFQEVDLYALRLLEPLSSTKPCRFNPAQQCQNLASFRLRADTPATPADGSELEAESQAWLLQVDAYEGNLPCGPGDRLDEKLVRFSNDRRFQGFTLKQSLALRVVPELAIPRKATTIRIFFQCRSPLPGQVLLRVEAPHGVDFDRGCLAEVGGVYSGCAGLGNIAVAQREGLTVGDHELALRAVNPARTPQPNWWLLESFADLALQTVFEGPFEQVRQSGRGDGYELLQSLQATVRPSSQQPGPINIFLWLKPRQAVPLGGRLELHAPQGFEMSCEPPLVLLAMPPGSCEAFHVPGLDDHDVVDFRLGGALTAGGEYELSVFSRNPTTIPSSLSRWGVLLSGDEVLEANMEVPQYPLTDFGMELLSLQSSNAAPNASNEVRMQLRFRSLSLGGISEIRIEAPPGWDFRPLCTRFQDITGGCQTRCTYQLPYAEERGHHTCPEANVLLLLMDRSAVIEGVFILMLAVCCPDAMEFLLRELVRDPICHFLFSTEMVSPIRRSLFLFV
ncbi:unnamed protein product [Effrenium voratum]|nr:unnamed protein product [Effrenium voratum]